MALRVRVVAVGTVSVVPVRVSRFDTETFSARWLRGRLFLWPCCAYMQCYNALECKAHPSEGAQTQGRQGREH